MLGALGDRKLLIIPSVMQYWINTKSMEWLLNFIKLARALLT
jgi:hypothetical protein